MKLPPSIIVVPLVVLAIGGLGVLGCRSTADSVAGCPSTELGATPVDKPLMAFLSAARAAHHQADIEQSRGDSKAAIAALEALATMPAPKAIEVDEVLADAYARLAELRLERDELQRAEADVAAGLAHAQAPTYFRGHLLEVEGLLEEARARSLADAGRVAAAERARAKAVRLLQEAVRTQENVIERALMDGGGNRDG